MQLAPISTSTTRAQVDVDPSDFTSPLSGADTSITEARAMLDELAVTSDAARGATLVSGIVSQVGFAAEQLDDAATSLDGIDAGAVASWQAARLLLDEAVGVVSRLEPAVTSTIDELAGLLDEAGGHVSLALDAYGI